MSTIISIGSLILAIAWLTRWYNTNLCIYMNESLTWGLIDNPLKVYSTLSACVCAWRNNHDSPMSFISSPSSTFASSYSSSVLLGLTASTVGMTIIRDIMQKLQSIAN